MTKQRRYLLAAALFLAAALATGTAYLLTLRSETAQLDQQLRDRLTIARHSVTSEIEHFRYLPPVVGKDARVRALLEGGDAGAAAEANAYLEEVRNMSGVDELYLLDSAGRTVAASNWNRPDGFLAQNYAFRPYFRDALARGTGRSYAVGVTTGRPGYFLSSRIGPAQQPLGVAVVKVDMKPLEATWARANDQVAVADALGVVFLSGRADWRYRPLHPLPAEAIARMRSEKRYGGQNVPNATPLLTPAGTIASPGGPLRVAKADISPDGWHILVAAPVAPLRERALLIAALTLLGCVLLTGAGGMIRQRRQIVRIRLNQATVLERRVEERTRDLAREVEERTRAEEELRATHESLVHAAKLAVLGRMSASVVHEVSQPLSALDATLAAAELHLAKGDTTRAGHSLGSARQLIGRMQGMVRTLKRFGARQKPAPPEAIPPRAALESALEILAPRLRDLGIGVETALPPGLPAVAGSPEQLQQVLANLILNAAEATARSGTTEPLQISAQPGPAALRLLIQDRGPGIPEEIRDRIFEPFFTTRTTGEGLGLGLAIVRTIVDHMGARLKFRPRAEGGTETILDLPLYTPQTGDRT